MAYNYIRQSTFSDGDRITASLFNNEYDQLLNAFAYSSTAEAGTGHRHDGTLGQGGNIFKIGDLDFLNKIEVDSTNNRWGFYVEVSSAAVEQIRIQDGGIVPVTDSDIDIGTTSLRFKDAFIDTITTTSNVAIGGNLTVTGNATIAGNLTFGDAATDTVSFSADVASNLLPSTNNTFDLGASSSQWKDLYIDGTANIDSLVADTADINGGTIDGATIATSNITVGSGKTLDVSAGTLTLADNQISGDKVEGGTIAATTITDLTFGSLNDGAITVTAFADEDDMSSNSATLVPTQQSVKAYVDAQVTAQDLDLTTDSGTIAIDLDSETLTVSGGTGIDSSATGNAVTLAIDSTVATLTGSQTLTNKTLTSPDINTPDIDGGTIDSTVIGGSTPAAGTFTTITGTLATAAQTNITSVGTLSSLTTSGDVTVGGNLTVNGTTTTLNTATLDVEDKNITLNKGSGDTSGSANGAGLTIQDAVDASTDATILWDTTNDEFDFSHPINVTGKITGTGTSVFANLDISGDVDIDGTLETDALTIGGVTSVPFEAADHSKLDGIEASATADQTASEIRTLVESATDSNVFTDADHSKLNGIEASADVTDATNVTAAGALMDSELTSEASVKALNQGVATTDSPTFAGITTSGTTNTANLTISGTQGTDGQVLTSTGSGVQWENASSGGVSGISSAITDSTIAININSIGKVGIGTNAHNSYSLYSDKAQIDNLNDSASATTGQFLTINGSSPSWADVSLKGIDVSSASSTTMITVLNDHVRFPSFTFSAYNPRLDIQNLAATSGSGNTTQIYNANSTAPTGWSRGNNLRLWQKSDTAGTVAGLSLITGSSSTTHGAWHIISVNSGNTYDSDFVITGTAGASSNTIGGGAAYPTERLRIDGVTGNIGIGYVPTSGNSFPTAASEMLDVNGTIRANNYKIGSDQGTNGQVMKSTGSGVVWGAAPAPNGIDVDSNVSSSDTLLELYEYKLQVNKWIEFNLVGSRNIAIGGYTSGGHSLNSSSSDNILMGTNAGNSVTSSSKVLAIGNYARSSGTASWDLAIGYAALGNSAATNGYNTAVGHHAGEGNYNGTENVYVGYYAGEDAQIAVGNTLVGFKAGRFMDKDGRNTALGWQALGSQDHPYTGPGEEQTFNVAVGYSAGSSLTTGRRNVFVGANTQLATQTDTDCIVLGDSVTSTGTGNFTFGSGSSDSNIANGATTITAPSDERYKEDITDSTAGLSFIKDLRPVTFKWKKEKDIPTTQVAYVEGSETRVMNDKTNHGFIAQEVKAVIDSHPEIKDGFDMWTEDEADGRQRIGPSALIPVLVKAIQELEARVNELENN